jgi:lysophospholipase L1-like esterase
MLDLCAELDLRCFDAYEALQARAQQGDALYYSDDMHLNPAGNRVLAEAISAWLNTP